jgi:hypothetical protein
VLSNEEWKSLKTSDTADRVVENINGGFCRGEDTPEIREFQMAVTRTGILNDEERQNMDAALS